MRRIGVFGGSFDPPHRAHLHIARAARDEFQLDEILWIPAHQPPHKQSDVLTSGPDRVSMLERLIEGESGFSISQIELERSGVSYTVDTLRDLHATHPGCQLFLIIGGDSLEHFRTWKNPDEITRLATLLVYRRSGHDSLGDNDLQQMYADRIRFLAGAEMDISSTEIRLMFRSRRDVPSEILPESITAFIQARGLYL